MTSSAFSSLALAPVLLQNLDSLGYQQMTEIQAQSLPLILEGRDLIAQAKTGSGKTAAFGLGLLHRLNPSYFAIQGLVLCPTRELADQVAQELRRLARQADNIKVLTLCGGAPMGPQIASLQHGAHIVVGTPGRIRDHLGRGSINLGTVKMLVLDEADRMVDMGFYDDIAGIVSACPSHRQTLLFSATYPDDIRRASAQFLRQPAEVKVEAQHDNSRIEQRFYKVTDDQRAAAVVALLQHYRPTSALLFCNTKIRCRELVQALQQQGFSALALYGDLEQRDRDETLLQFANQSCSVLVATDVAARGLDISSLSAVINVDVSKDTEVHIHRVGRTGRAGDKGLALCLASPSENKWVKLIEQYQDRPVEWFDLPVPEAGGEPLQAPMVTLNIFGGKKDKLRPGDILGALTGEAGIPAAKIGKINVFEFYSYVAVARDVAQLALKRLSNGQIKGRKAKARFLQGPAD
ncbi:MAG: ATP-dependent helicase DbpA [Pseudomonadota bacterium]